MVLHTGLVLAPLPWLLDREGVSVSVTTTVFTNGSVLRCTNGFVGKGDCDRDCDDCDCDFGSDGCDDCDCDDCDCDCELLYSSIVDEYDLVFSFGLWSSLSSVYKGITGKWWLPTMERLRPNRTPEDTVLDRQSGGRMLKGK